MERCKEPIRINNDRRKRVGLPAAAAKRSTKKTTNRKRKTASVSFLASCNFSDSLTSSLPVPKPEEVLECSWSVESESSGVLPAAFSLCSEWSTDSRSSSTSLPAKMVAAASDFDMLISKLLCLLLVGSSVGLGVAVSSAT